MRLSMFEGLEPLKRDFLGILPPSFPTKHKSVVVACVLQ